MLPVNTASACSLGVRERSDIYQTWLPAAPRADDWLKPVLSGSRGSHSLDAFVGFTTQLQKLSLLNLENGNIGLDEDNFWAVIFIPLSHCIYDFIT